MLVVIGFDGEVALQGFGIPRRSPFCGYDERCRGIVASLVERLQIRAVSPDLMEVHQHASDGASNSSVRVLGTPGETVVAWEERVGLVEEVHYTSQVEIEDERREMPGGTLEPVLEPVLELKTLGARALVS
jgi:hypothetical protein